MPPATQSLWPSDIRAEIQSPFQILSEQADALSRQTNRRLIGETRTVQSDDQKASLIHLDMYAPVLDYRHRVLSVSHAPTLVYPVVVDAEIFRRSLTPREAMARIAEKGGLLSAIPGISPFPAKKENEASSADELIALVKRVLTSPEIVSAANSLIAKSEDAIREKEAIARTAKDTADVLSAVARQQGGESPTGSGEAE